jgi:hypothetical protein
MKPQASTVPGLKLCQGGLLLLFVYLGKPPTDDGGFRDFYHTGRILFYNSWNENFNSWNENFENFGKLQMHCSEFHE